MLFPLRQTNFSSFWKLFVFPSFHFSLVFPHVLGHFCRLTFQNVSVNIWPNLVLAKLGLGQTWSWPNLVWPNLVTKLGQNLVSPFHPSSLSFNRGLKILCQPPSPSLSKGGFNLPLNPPLNSSPFQQGFKLPLSTLPETLPVALPQGRARGWFSGEVGWFSGGWVGSVMADFGQTYFGQSDFGQFFDRLWPIVGLTDFSQTDFGQF